MSSGTVKEEENVENTIRIQTDLELEYILSKLAIPFSKLFNKNREPDIYNGTEKIPFEKRHPIFKALMRTEFEK